MMPKQQTDASRNGLAALVTLFLLNSLQSVALGQTPNPPLINDAPPLTNLVPDEKTAVAIAVAVLTPIYGEKQIKFESPFTARLHDDIWYVEGHVPLGWFGSAAIVEINRNSGTILSILHTK